MSEAVRDRGWMLCIPIILVHAAVVVLGLVDRLVFDPHAHSPVLLLDNVVDSHWWILLNGLGAAGLTYALLVGDHLIRALAYSAAVLGVWSLLALLWGLLAPVGPSLLGPVLGLVAACAAWILMALVADRTIIPPRG